MCSNNCGIAKGNKSADLISHIIKDNDDLRVLFRGLSDRAKEVIQSPDQKENLRTYKLALQTKLQELKQLQEQCYDVSKVHNEELETIKKTKSKIIAQKETIEHMELQIACYDEDNYETMECKEHQKTLKSRVKRLDSEFIDQQEQYKEILKECDKQMEETTALRSDNCELEERKQELESLQEEVCKKETNLKESIEYKDALIERIKTNIHEVKCQSKDVTLRIENLREKQEANERELKHKKCVIQEMEGKEVMVRNKVCELQDESQKLQTMLQEMTIEERSLRQQLREKQQHLTQAKLQLGQLITRINLCKQCKMLESIDSCKTKDRTSRVSSCDSSSLVSTMRSSTVCMHNLIIKEKKYKDSSQEHDTCEDSIDQNLSEQCTQ